MEDWRPTRLAARRRRMYREIRLQQEVSHMNPAPDTTVPKEPCRRQWRLQSCGALAAAGETGTYRRDARTRFASRAAAYDRENRFFDEDFEELRAAKYLLLPLPSEFGGAGMTLAKFAGSNAGWRITPPPLRLP